MVTTLHRAGWDHPHPGQTPRPSQHPLWSRSVTPGHLSLLMFRKLSFWDHKIIFPSFTALISPLKSPAIYLPIYLSPLSLPSLLQQLPVLPWDGPHCLTLQHELSARSTTTQMDTASCIPLPISAQRSGCRTRTPHHLTAATSESPASTMGEARAARCLLGNQLNELQSLPVQILLTLCSGADLGNRV